MADLMAMKHEHSTPRFTDMMKDRIKYGPLRVGIGGPVGAGKTSMTEAICRALGDDISMAVITNDIYTREDADYFVRRRFI